VRSAPYILSLLPGADRGSRESVCVALQRAYGNRAVAGLVSVHGGGGNAPQVTLHGQTSGNFDGGTSKILRPRLARARGCDCPEEDPCLRATGTLQITYRSTVTIEMPEVPGGLSECQEERVRTFLRNVLGPHERENARRLRTYDGTTSRTFAVTGCGSQAVNEAAQDKAQEMHDTEAAQRAADADALSLAIDPFVRPIDLDC